MSEIRLNMITREWVIVATDRARRPEEFRNRGNRHYLPEHDPSCPFCQGNESKTPHEILRSPTDGSWRIRVTENKFSVLAPEGDRVRVNEGLKRYVSGVGRHEIIIETPRHDISFCHLEDAHAREVVAAYQSRFRAAFEDKRVQHAIVFKNQGPDSGTSLPHSHAQLIGVPVVPSLVRIRVDEFMRYFDTVGDCLICATLKDELHDQRRVIEESAHFVAFIPYAAISPFHTWIFPKRHMPSFSNAVPEELDDLALIVKRTLKRLHNGLDNPSYNMVIRSLSPFRSRSEYLHWYLSIMPRVTATHAFELGTGVHVNLLMPETAAEYLRKARL